jgi:hypothetical protein
MWPMLAQLTAATAGSTWANASELQYALATTSEPRECHYRRHGGHLLIPPYSHLWSAALVCAQALRAHAAQRRAAHACGPRAEGPLRDGSWPRRGCQQPCRPHGRSPREQQVLGGHRVHQTWCRRTSSSPPTLRVRPNHDVAIIDDSSLLVAKKCIPDDPARLHSTNRLVSRT